MMMIIVIAHKYTARVDYSRRELLKLFTLLLEQASDAMQCASACAQTPLKSGKQRKANSATVLCSSMLASGMHAINKPTD